MLHSSSWISEILSVTSKLFWDLFLDTQAGPGPQNPNANLNPLCEKFVRAVTSVWRVAIGIVYDLVDIAANSRCSDQSECQSETKII